MYVDYGTVAVFATSRVVGTAKQKQTTVWAGAMPPVEKRRDGYGTWLTCSQR